MAAQAIEETAQALAPVAAAKPVCSECRHHVPGATSPACWCKLPRAAQSGQPVSARQPACPDFASWPEGSPVPAFLAAMRL
jgi:hypothetical protein